MTIETKYNIGDEVWGEWYIDAVKFKVKGIGVIVDEGDTQILYDLVGVDDVLEVASLCEEDIFQTKEELLNSL